MEKEFVPYELSVKLKELGFDEPCSAYYVPEAHDRICYQEYGGEALNMNNIKTSVGYACISAPLYQQAFRWFREKYKQSHIWMMDELLDTGEYTYEEAELACLDKLIEIVESKSE